MPLQTSFKQNTGSEYIFTHHIMLHLFSTIVVVDSF